MAEYNGKSVVIYYVDGENGNDSNAGTATSTAWKTIQKGFDNIIDNTLNDGDELRILKTTNDAEHYKLAGTTQGHAADVPLDAGWNNREVIINGAGSSADGGLVDGTIVEINGSGINDATPMMLWDTATSDYTNLTHLYFNAADSAQHCVETSVANIHSVTWTNCQFANALDHGIATNSNNNYWNFIHCRFNNNGGSGIHSIGTQFNLYYKCLFDENAVDGGRIGILSRIVDCVFHNNGGDGGSIANTGAVVCNCLFDGNTGHGASCASSGQSTWVNNMYSNNGGKGLKVATATETRQFYSAFYNNDIWGSTGATDHLSMYNILAGSPGDFGAGSTGPETTWGSTADFDFTPDGASNVIGSGMPMPYKTLGTTASDRGVGKWANTEKISIL